MSQKMNRQEFFKKSAKYSLGVAAGVAGLQALSKNEAQGKTTSSFPFTYSQLDPEAARILGHDAYFSGKGCSYGAFEAIIQPLRDTVGSPFTELPSEMMTYGHGGTVGWGTLCGAINGAAGAMSLFLERSDADPLINELVGWYTQALFPSDESNQLGVNQSYSVIKYSESLAQNQCNSPLCHVSVTNWCDASGIKVSDIKRKERCGRLTGDVAAKAVQILNDHFNDQFSPAYEPPESIAACMLCHGNMIKDNVASKMECQSCHGDPHAPAGVAKMETMQDNYSLEQNYPNPFNPNTSIQFSLPKMEAVNLKIYDINGRLIKTLINNQTYSQGKHTIRWDGRDQFGNRVSSGMYFYRFNAGSFQKSESMMLVK